MDVVPYHFVVGPYEPRYHHGMGDRLVVCECRFLSRTPFPWSLMLIRIATVVAAQLHHRHVPICRCVCSCEQHCHKKVRILWKGARVRRTKPLSIVSLVLLSQYARPLDRTPSASPAHPFSLQLFANKMYTALNPRWASSVLGFFAILCIPIPFVLMR